MIKQRKWLSLGLVAALALTGCGAKTYEKLDLSKYQTRGEYKGLSYTPADTSASDYDVECAVRKLLAGKGYETQSFDEIKEGAVQIGDTANIDYVGKLNGVAFEGGTANGDSLEIGSGRFIAGFEEGLVGVRIGDTVDLNLTFPESYGNAELAGQKVVFTVTVNYVSARKTYKELTDTMANELDENAKTAEELYANTRKTLETQNAAEAEQELVEQLWSQAVLNCKLEDKLPENLLKAEQDAIVSNYEQQVIRLGYGSISAWLTAQKYTQEQFDQMVDSYSRSNVRQKMAAWAIVEAEGYQLTDEIYNEKLAAYAKSAGAEEKVYEEAIGKDVIRDDIVLEYAKNLVRETAVAK